MIRLADTALIEAILSYGILTFMIESSILWGRSRIYSILSSGPTVQGTK